VVFVYDGAPLPWVTSVLIKDGEVAVGDLAFDPVTSPSFGQLKHLSIHVTGNGTRYKDHTWNHGMGAAPLGVVATIDVTGVGGWWGVNTYNPSATSVKFRVFSIDGGNWSDSLNLRALGIWAWLLDVPTGSRDLWLGI